MSAIVPDASLPQYQRAPGGTGFGGAGSAHSGAPAGMSKAAWIKVGTITLLMVAIFWPNLSRLWQKTNPLSTQPDAGNWQHAIAVPLIGLYYLYANREQLLAAPVRSRRLGTGRRQKDLRTLGFMFLFAWVMPCAALLALGLHNSFFGLQLFIAITILFANVAASLFVPSFQLGFLILIEGLAVALFGIHPGHNDFVWDFGMVVTLFGVVLMLTGWDVMKIAWFPIVFLVCALPWPGLVYSWVAGPLQALAAKVAVGTLRFTGVDIIRSGTKMLMMVPNKLTGQDELRVLNVAEACAGLRSLMTFITVAAAVAFLSARPLWQKLVITASAIPIAILCNVMRVSGQGLLDRYVSQDLAEGFAHQFVGVVMLIPAFLLILLVCWLLDHLFVDEVDERERERLRMGGGRGGEKKIIQIQRPGLATAGAPVGTAPRATGAIPVPRAAGVPRVGGPAGAVPLPPPRVQPLGGGTQPPRPAATQAPSPTAKPAGSAPKPSTKGAAQPPVPPPPRAPGRTPPAQGRENP